MKTPLLQFATFILVIGLIALLAWLTLYEEDPCDNIGDAGAAILAEDGDQDALVNRAIIVRSNCEKRTED
mgnify:CR=1 FL=1|jgi:hypothetical protein